MIDLLRAIWQADSAFPSGSFTFSGGLEAFLALTPEADVRGLSHVLNDMLTHRWARADRVALAIAHRAGGDVTAIAEADAAIEAATFVEALRSGSRRNGMALLLAHERLRTPSADRLRAACRDGRCLGHFAVMQGALFRALGIGLHAAIAAAGYAFCSTMITAAIRLGRIGALDGQRILQDLLFPVAALAADPPSPGAMPEGFTPCLDIAAARHRHAAMRLFVN